VDVDTRHLTRELLRRVTHAPPPQRGAGSRIEDMLSTRFEKQREVIGCKARRIAAMCTRRAGKTELVPARLYSTAEKYPGTVLYYVGITGKRARELMWAPLTKANDFYALGWKTNETRQTLTHPDGTEIRLVGADDMRELEKRRGDKASIVIVDEAQSFPHAVLHALVEDIFGPALVDVRGTFMLLGTPGIVCGGFWYDVTRNEDDDSRAKRDARWTVFEWSALDNPHVAANVALEIAERDAAYGEDDPTTCREYRGRWVNDAGALFYRFDARRNTYDGTLPAGHTWAHVMGVDLGHDDAFAMEVFAFSDSHPDLFEVAFYKKAGLIPAQWAERIRDFQERYNPARIVVDTGGLGKAIVKEMQDRHSLPVEAAEKQSKAAYVRLLNGDLALGRVKVLVDSELAREWSVLPKDADDPEAEDPRFPNHCADAALYGWREALHFLGRHPDEQPDEGTPEWHEKQAAERKERHRAAFERRQRESQEDAW
jgi:hypothetical protein